MKRGQTLAFYLAGGLFLLSAVCVAFADDGPYKAIVTRNLFALLPPPPPVPVDAPLPPANIKLTGISTLFGDKRAMLMVQDVSGPGKPEQSLILREGQRDGQIEILQIDEQAGSVQLKNAGVAATLTFDQNGNKTAGGSGAPAPGGRGINPNMPAIPQPQRQIPMRQLRLPQPVVPPAANTTPPAQPNMTAEEQLLLMHANQMIQQDNAAQGGQVAPMMPPLPPLPPMPGE